ncbi:SAM-dependent methyltransferase [Nocardia mexicana]|nr:class I SAM-dependent methyltransferase [Nocardia mexicana]
MHKYGPGPRIHFHVGLFPGGAEPTSDVPGYVLQRRLHDSQEEALTHAAAAWDVAGHRPAELLDIGCGVGGGSLFWAQEHDAAVTGLTVAADHVGVMRELVRHAGAQGRVSVRAQDVHSLTDRNAFDAAVAFESSGYMNRTRLFEVVATALRPGGWFGIQEHFPFRSDCAVTALLDDYYKTRLGVLEEYLSAAAATGFVLETDEDVTERVTEFWMQSAAWTTAELAAIDDGQASPIRRERLMQSCVFHGRLFRLWRDHAVQTRQLLFRLSR